MAFFRDSDKTSYRAPFLRAALPSDSEFDYGSITHPVRCAGLFEVLRQSGSVVSILVDRGETEFKIGQSLELMVGGRPVSVVVDKISREQDGRVQLRLLEQTLVVG